MMTNELASVEKWLPTISPAHLITQHASSQKMKDQLAWLNEETYRIKGNFQSRFYDFKARHGTDYRSWGFIKMQVAIINGMS